MTPILRLSPEAVRHKLLSDIKLFFVAPVVQQGKNPAVDPPNTLGFLYMSCHPNLLGIHENLL